MTDIPPPGGWLGAHLSHAGGPAAVPARAKSLGATAMQFFSKMGNRWAEPACEADVCRAFTEGVADAGVRVFSVHDSYLINLASPDHVLRTRSLVSFIAELKRCKALGVPLLVSHPGNFMDDRASGIDRNADAITMALEIVPSDTRLLMEMTAGSGTSIGATFEEMALLIQRVGSGVRARVGVCVDTAHVFAAGYDLVNDYEGVWSRFESTLGWHRLGMMHLNDSKAPLGARRDRHELIGEGAIGEMPFRRIMNDERLRAIPKVIETPKLGDAPATDARMLDRLRGYLVSGGERD